MTQELFLVPKREGSRGRRAIPFPHQEAGLLADLGYPLLEVLDIWIRILRRLSPVSVALMTFYTVALAYWLAFREAIVLEAGQPIVYSQPAAAMFRQKVGPLGNGFIEIKRLIAMEAPTPVELTCVAPGTPDGPDAALATTYELVFDDGAREGSLRLLKGCRVWREADEDIEL